MISLVPLAPLTEISPWALLLALPIGVVAGAGQALAVRRRRLAHAATASWLGVSRVDRLYLVNPYVDLWNSCRTRRHSSRRKLRRTCLRGSLAKLEAATLLGQPNEDRRLASLKRPEQHLAEAHRLVRLITDWDSEQETLRLARLRDAERPPRRRRAPRRKARPAADRR